MAQQRTAPRPVRRPRLHRRYWLTPAVLAVVLLVVAVTGGFRAAPAAGVRTFPAGQAISLQRWQLEVVGVDLVDTTSYGSPQAPALRVLVDATWTGERSVYGMSQGLVTLVVPNGPAPDPEASNATVERYSGGFDPDVPRPVAFDFTWPKGATETSQPSPVPATALVVVSDERPAQNFLFADQWAVTRPIGHVAVPVIDRRARR